jgi:predicted nucleotidyltransferase component of viral defense system
MLTLDRILSQYSSSEQLYPRNILVEYIQCEILDSLFKQKESVSLSFIGGTALRIVYGGNRFSEDLDFDNFGLDFKQFQYLLEKVVRDMEVKGFSLEFRFVEKLAFHCYVKFPDILRRGDLAKHPEEKILVRIDTVQKEKIFQPDVYTLNTFDLYRDIAVNPLSIILSQKLIAIVGRKREKGRDFYDVSLLWGRVEPDFSYIQRMTGLDKKIFLEKIVNRCEFIDFDNLARDVEPFLVDADQSARVKNFLSFARQNFVV